MKEPEIKKPKQEETTKKDRTASAFSALMSDSDSEVEEEVVEVKAPAKPLLTGYASALLSTPLKPEERIFSWPKKLVVKDPNRKFMWADCDSDSGGSEDEDEDEE
jgi:hypothetical protein